MSYLPGASYPHLIFQLNDRSPRCFLHLCMQYKQLGQSTLHILSRICWVTLPQDDIKKPAPDWPAVIPASIFRTADFMITDRTNFVRTRRWKIRETMFLIASGCNVEAGRSGWVWNPTNNNSSGRRKKSAQVCNQPHRPVPAPWGMLEDPLMKWLML